MKRLYSFFTSFDSLFLILISCAFTLLRLPSLFEPYWYGDEGIYEVIGFALRHGRILYTGIWDNKPPLLYFIYALVNGDQQGAKFLSLLTGLIAVFLFFALSKKMFRKNASITYIITGVFVVLFATPFLEGTVANAENFMIFPALFAAHLIWDFVEKKKSLVYPFLAGLLLGFSFLIKVVAVFDFGAFFLFLFILQYKDLKNIVKQIVPLFVFGISFSLPIIGLLGMYFFQGTIKIALQSMFFSNVGYVGYGNTFIIPQGLLILKFMMLLGTSFVLFIKRKIFSSSLIFIILWFVFGLFSAYFSQRPYTHYVLVLLSSSMLCVGLCFFGKKFRIIFSLILLSIFLFIAFSFSLNVRRSFFTYYANFLSYVRGSETTTSYYSFFDQVTPRDYAIVDFLRLHKRPKDQLFIWGDSGQIYKLANALPPGRFIVAYHVTLTKANEEETKAVLERIRPRFVVMLPNQPEIPFSLMHYKPLYIIDGALVYAKTF